MSRLSFAAFVLAVALAGCATTSSSASASADKPPMGTISDLSRVEGNAAFCEHKVPEQVCTLHHPELVAKFKAVNDWCPEHGVPESQCHACHPGLTFEKLPTLREGADLKIISAKGEDVPDLAAHAVAGKVTVFDFYADWCAACREVDLHAYKLLNQRDDVAVRKLNVVDWDSALAKHFLANVPSLPYVVVYGRLGKEVKALKGLDLAALDRAIAEGAAQ